MLTSEKHSPMRNPRAGLYTLFLPIATLWTLRSQVMSISMVGVSFVLLPWAPFSDFPKIMCLYGLDGDLESGNFSNLLYTVVCKSFLQALDVARSLPSKKGMSRLIFEI